MSEKEGHLPGTATQDEEAYAWVVRLSSDQRTHQDQAGFEQWLDEDEQNPARFEEGLQLWDALGSLKGNADAHAALGHLYTSSVGQDLDPPRWALSRRQALRGGLGAMAAALAGVLILPKVLVRGPAIYQTARGEQRRVTLADGTNVVLDTATRLQVVFEDNQRLVTLERGQAFFDVAHDPSRPFRVFAGADEIRALGTAFEVRFEGGRTRVILEEGRVAVFRGTVKPDPGKSPPRPVAAKPDLILEPGEQAKLALAEPVKATQVDLAKTNAWRDGDLVFDDVSLSQAVAEVNRYGGREIVLADSSLGSLRISGTFHTNRPETFVEGVTAALPVRLQQSDKAKLVLAGS